MTMEILTPPHRLRAGMRLQSSALRHSLSISSKGRSAARSTCSWGSLGTFTCCAEPSTSAVVGPFYRITCLEGNDVIGVTNGFIAPIFSLMHCETLRIFTRRLPRELRQRVGQDPLSLSLLLGAATFSFGFAAGCTKAEILAINDSDEMHARLVRYYKFFGFEPVHVVEGGLSDVPHMLVWGGVGTRMDASIPRILERWTPALRKSLDKSNSTTS